MLKIPKNVNIKITLYNNDYSFGNGICKLLLLIDEYKSINRACKEMRMAYSKAFKMINRAAIKEVRTKIEILSEDFAVRHDYNPIHHIESRLKTTESIEEKLMRLDKEISIASAKENLFDIAGIRVVCNFIDDVYAVADS